MNFRRCVLIIAGLAAEFSVLVNSALGLCQVPRPRSVCAEFSNSEAVVIAKLTAIREYESGPYSGGHVYHFELEGAFKSSARLQRVFDIWEENSSGRATFLWVAGGRYSLYLYRSQKEGMWSIDGCGNSHPALASEVVLAIDGPHKAKPRPAMIEGMVSTDSWTTGVPEVTIRAARNGRAFKAKTDAAGRFRMEVPPGTYKLRAEREGSSFERNPFSYENPGRSTSRLRELRAGAVECAMMARRRKDAGGDR